MFFRKSKKKEKNINFQKYGVFFIMTGASNSVIWIYISRFFVCFLAQKII